MPVKWRKRNGIPEASFILEGVPFGVGVRVQLAAAPPWDAPSGAEETWRAHRLSAPLTHLPAFPGFGAGRERLSPALLLSALMVFEGFLFPREIMNASLQTVGENILFGSN